MFKPYGDFYRFLPPNMTGYHHMHLYHTADHAPLEKCIYITDNEEAAGNLLLLVWWLLV